MFTEKYRFLLFNIFIFSESSSAWTIPKTSTLSLQSVASDLSPTRNRIYQQKVPNKNDERNFETAQSKSRPCTRLFSVTAADGSSSTSSSSSAAAPVLTVEGLSCTHNGGETWQLKDVDLNLQRGSKAALIGRFFKVTIFDGFDSFIADIVAAGIPTNDWDCSVDYL